MDWSRLSWPCAVEPERSWHCGGWGSGPAAGWREELRMKKKKSRTVPWSDPGAAGWSYRTGSPLCGGLDCCDPHLPAHLPAPPASWLGCPQQIGCPRVTKGWKGLPSNSSYLAGSGPCGWTGGLQFWCVGNRGEAVAGDSQLPRCTDRSPSGKHPGSTPGGDERTKEVT